jgi:hypothetical protein
MEVIGGENMDVVEIITNVGFPIACVIGLGWFVLKLYKDSVAREERLMEVNEKAISTIAKYADRLDGIQADVQTIKQDMVLLLQNGDDGK